MMALALLSAVLAGAGAAEPRETGLRLVRNTGLVIVSYEGESWFGGREAALPMPIPPGAEVTALSGRAELEGCGLRLRLVEGDSFVYNTFPETECSSPVQVAATGDATMVELRVADVVAVLAAGDAVEVRKTRRGGFELQVLAGWLDFLSPGGASYLTAGQVLVVPGQEPVRAAPVAASAAPEPGEELRSAPAPLRRSRNVPGASGLGGTSPGERPPRAGPAAWRRAAPAQTASRQAAPWKAVPLRPETSDLPARPWPWPELALATALALAADAGLRRLSRRGR